MKIAFTICSNNYLAAAKALAESFLRYHNDYTFFIGLADIYPAELEGDYINRANILEVRKLSIGNLEDLYSKYNITEFNTAVKPTYFSYFFENMGAEKVIYLDPDILVFSRFEEVDTLLSTYNIILTPHILQPVDDEYTPTDYQTLRGGVFNLGFIALSNYPLIKTFLGWWHERVIKYGYGDFTKNMFYDQLWMNFVPCFYNNYYILKHTGYNMAPWNLHERFLNKVNNEIIVNEDCPLRFFHFSSYKHDQPEIISFHLSRYDFKSRPDLLPVFNLYNKILEQNNISSVRHLKVAYYPTLHNTKKINYTLFGGLGWRFSQAFQLLLHGKTSKN